jgi:ParB family transcriptional regulator, chromosome partitioning protein
MSATKNDGTTLKKPAARTRKSSTGVKKTPATELQEDTAAPAALQADSKQEDAAAPVVLQTESKQEDTVAPVPTNSTQPASLQVPINMIVLPKSQPRRYFDPKAIESLVTSVKHEGILQPILLRRADNKYELVAGERRFIAAQKAGLTEIPAVVKEMSDSQAMECALTENLQREDLNPVEETEAILDLLALKLSTNREGVIALLNKLSKVGRGLADNDVRSSDLQILESVFQTIGKISPEAFRVHRLRLLKLPSDILEALRAGDIEYTKAKEIAKLESEEDRKQLLEEAIEFSLSFSEIHKKVLEKKPKSEQYQLQSRLDTAYKQAKKSKVWENPDKQEKLNSLLAELEALLGGD